MPIPPAMQATAFSQKGIESMRGRKDPEAVRVVAREMESLFAYEMVKAMRSASDTSAAGGKGFGGEVYGTMFDMELARLLSSKGLGLQEMILKGMGQAASPAAGASSPAVREAFVLPSAAGEGAAPAESVSVEGPSADAVSVDGAAVRNPAPHTRQRLEESVAAAPVIPPSAESMPALHTHDSVEEADPVPSEEGALPIREGGRVSSSYGYRKDPFTGESKFHHGIDISAPSGTEIYPVKSGIVTFSGSRTGYGNIVEIDHGSGLVTRYAHNRANRVAAGDRVDPETVIAEVGSTGRSTGPHLHFEVHYEGQKVPPQMVFSGIAKGRG